MEEGEQGVLVGEELSESPDLNRQDSARGDLMGIGAVLENDAKSDRIASSAVSSSTVRGGIITARGTSDGLVIRLDGRVDSQSLSDALDEFLQARKAFLSGQEVAFEWVGSRPGDDIIQELIQLLHQKFSIKVKASRMRETQGRDSSPLVSGQPPGKTIGRPMPARIRGSSGDESRGLNLFDGMEVLSEGRTDSMTGGFVGSSSIAGSSQRTGLPEAFWDDADARIIYTTLRSGQKIETDHSLVIMGDVNSGAEIIAGGDIVVLGTLRGVAHAGAYDETGGGRIIFALNLQATQLRIGMVISRGSTDRGSSDNQRVAEIARVEGGLIVVEAYTGKSLQSRRRE